MYPNKFDTVKLLRGSSYNMISILVKIEYTQWLRRIPVMAHQCNFDFHLPYSKCNCQQLECKELFLNLLPGFPINCT